jgi:hypothetical protein
LIPWTFQGWDYHPVPAQPPSLKWMEKGWTMSLSDLEACRSQEHGVFSVSFRKCINFISDERGCYATLSQIQKLKEACEYVLANQESYENCRQNRERLVYILNHEFWREDIPYPTVVCNCPTCIAFDKYVRYQLDRRRELRREEVKPKRTKTFIYLGTNRFGEYKIGQSLDVKLRESTLQSEDPEFSIVNFWSGKPEDETKLHRKFSSKRKRGEWFVLSADEVQEIHQYFESRS